MSSCTFLFNVEDNSISKISNYEELQNAIGGTYDLFDENIYYGYSYSNYLADDRSSAMSTLICNDTYNRSLPGNIPKYLNPIESEVLDDRTWIETYDVITSINNILIQFEEKIGRDKSIDELLGEMYFIRAYCYFRLTRIYGQLPIIKDVDVNYTVAKSGYAQVYQFIEDDLKKAMAYLPNNRESCRIPNRTPHRGMVKALLAEVYLSWAGYPINDQSKYESASTIAKEVIDSTSYFGFELLPDFLELWNEKNIYNKEGIICYYLDRSKHITVKSNFYYITKNSYRYEKESWQHGIYASNESIISFGYPEVPEIHFYNDYPEGYRKDITFWNEVYVPWWYANNRAQLDTGFQHIRVMTPTNRVCYRKFYIDTIGQLPGTVNEHVPNGFRAVFGTPKSYLLRYAQTLLTYAEATARSGNVTPLAYDCINQIRRRANHLPLERPSKYDLQTGLSAGAFADSVFSERGWELAGEPNGRWYDVLRMKRMPDILNKRDPNEGYLEFHEFTDDMYFRPIVGSDVILNPNLN